MLEPAYWYAWIKVLAFLAGVFVGGYAVYSPAWVWLNMQKLKGTAAFLAAIGCLMVGMSIWQSVQLEAPGGFKMIMSEIDKMKQVIADVSIDVNKSKSDIAATAAAAEKLNTVFSLSSIQEEMFYADITNRLKDSSYTPEETDKILALVKSALDSAKDYDVKDFKSWPNPK